ncbi:MAG: LytTR family DNA-binding domain-containing protein [Clostridia bacterium]
MINIFLYVKDTEQLKNMQKKIRDFFNEMKQSVKIGATFDFNIAKTHIKENTKNIDVFLIDFSGKMESVELAKLYYEKSHESLWVFMNQSIELLVKLLYFRPSYYLKSLDDEKLNVALKIMFREYTNKIKDEYFTFKCEGDYVRIPFSKISYLESQAKKVTIHICNEKKRYEFIAKLDDILEKFPSFFIKCHQSYIVNMNLVRILNKKSQSFTLFTGDNVFISRRKLNEVEEKYNEFLAVKNI